MFQQSSSETAYLVKLLLMLLSKGRFGGSWRQLMTFYPTRLKGGEGELAFPRTESRMWAEESGGHRLTVLMTKRDYWDVFPSEVMQ